VHKSLVRVTSEVRFACRVNVRFACRGVFITMDRVVHTYGLECAVQSGRSAHAPI